VKNVKIIQIFLLLFLSLGPSCLISLGSKDGKREIASILEDCYDLSKDFLIRTKAYARNRLRPFYHFKSEGGGDLEAISIDLEYQKALHQMILDEQDLIDSIEKSYLRSIYNISTFNKGRPAHNHFRGRKGFFGKIFSVTQDFVVPFGKFLFPIPLPDHWGRGPTHKIFIKLWKNSQYIPNKEELKLLQKYNSYEYFLRVRYIFQQSPRAKKVRRSIYISADVAKIMTTIGASLYVYEQLQGGLLNLDTFLKDEKYRLEDNQVQLIMETVPFPHMAIRLGNTIYSYGQTHMSATPISQYLDNRKYNQAIKEKMKQAGIEIKEEEIDMTGKPLSDRISAQMGLVSDYLMNKTGLSELPKSVQVVTINLSKEDRSNLKRDLVLKTGNRYANSTFVNDCATMVLRALDKSTDFDMQNRLWDASPSQTAMILATMKAAGNDNIGPIYQVAIEEVDKPIEHLMRNAYINILESKIFIELFHFNQIHRTVIEATLGEEGLESRDPVTEKYIKEWETDIEQLMMKDLQLQIIEDQVSKYAGLAEDQKEEAEKEYRESIDFIFSRFMAKSESLAGSKESDLQTIILNEYKLVYLENLKGELLEKLAKGK
jgi:hypothetical protein